VELTQTGFMAWHDGTCATLKLEWEDGRPGCLTCQRKAPALAPVHPISPPGPPPDVPRSQLVCTWPPRLFSNDSFAITPKAKRHFRFASDSSESSDPSDTEWFSDDSDGHSIRKSSEDASNSYGNEFVLSLEGDTDSSSSKDILGDENANIISLLRSNIDQWTSSNTIQQSQVSLESTKKRIQQQYSSSDSATSFQSIYSCLPNADSIRLLRLHGSAIESAPVHCTLLVHGLRDPSRPTYEAFSYTWADSRGDSSLCEAIFVGPQYDVLPVTGNCLASLKCFRTVADRLVWVDAICINQFDLEERGHQVSLMRDVYTSAARVLTYLGHIDEPLRDLTALPYINHRRSGNSYEPSTADISEILCLPYFSRIWVIQEVLLNKNATLTVGKHTLHWQDFRNLARHSLSSRDRKPALIKKKPLRDLRRMRYRTLLSWLKATKNCQCGDVRDRVYGLMGLSSRKDRENLPVDYSISKQQLYIGLAIYWLMPENGTRGLISAVLDMALLPKITPFLPSWTPDWTPQSHTDADEVRNSSVPLTLQMDTNRIGSPSSGLNWSETFGRDEDAKPCLGWTLEIAFKTCASHAPIEPLSLGGTLALDAFHILSISAGKPNLLDTRRRPLYGMQLTHFEDSEPRRRDRPDGDVHLFVSADWQESLVLRKHANAVYSLRNKFRIVCAPPGVTLPSRSEKVSEIETRLELFEADIAEHWVMDLFFYGNRAGSAYADLLRGSKTNERWSKPFPQAAAACEVLNLPFKKHTGEEYRHPTIAEMIEISEDARDFVDKVKGPWESGSSSESLDLNSDSRDYPDSSRWSYYVSRGDDQRLAMRIQQAYAAKLETAPSPEELWTHLRSVVRDHRRSCKDYAPLQHAILDLEDRVNERLINRFSGPSGNDLLHLLVPDSVRIGAKKMGSFLKVDWTITNIMWTAWALLQELKIDPKLTLKQNWSIVCIHVLTMEMVARLRGCLQQRLILNAIRDKMRHSEKIYLI